jgi:putative FmdB family regulatory protein
MPIYEYRCRKCDAQFEVLQKIGADGADLICPECGEKYPEKLMSMFASADDSGSARGCGAPGGFT